MTRTRRIRFIHAILIATILAVAVTAAAPETASACGTLNSSCCLPGNTCSSGLTCQTGVCRSSVTPPPPGGGPITLTNPLGGTSDIRDLIQRFATILRDFATPVAVLMILFGAFRILTAAGDPAKFETGKKILLYTAIGYAIVFIGWGIVSIIESLLSS